MAGNAPFPPGIGAKTILERLSGARGNPVRCWEEHRFPSGAVVTTRLLYIDDSGADQTALSVFGWVELALPHWNDALRGWLDWRHGLYPSVGVPADYELHSTRFVGGSDRPTGTGWDEVKSHRSVVMGEALRTIAALPGLCVGAAYQRTQPGARHHVSKADTYARLVRHLDSRLSAAGGSA